MHFIIIPQDYLWEPVEKDGCIVLESRGFLEWFLVGRYCLEMSCEDI